MLLKRLESKAGDYTSFSSSHIMHFHTLKAAVSCVSYGIGGWPTFILMPEFNTEQSGVCRGCALGKYTKIAFSSSDSISAGVLDLIHSDLCGPMSYASLTGFEYYVTFIDDYSKKTWIYFVRNKES